MPVRAEPYRGNWCACNVGSFDQHIKSKRHGAGDDTSLWEIDSHFLESVRQSRIAPGVWFWQNPRLVREFGKIDLATAGQPIVAAHDDRQSVMEQRLDF